MLKQNALIYMEEKYGLSEKEIKDIERNNSMHIGKYGRIDRFKLDDAIAFCDDYLVASYEEKREQARNVIADNKKHIQKMLSDYFSTVSQQYLNFIKYLNEAKDRNAKKLRKLFQDNPEELFILMNIRFFPFFAQSFKEKAIAYDEKLEIVSITKELFYRYRKGLEGKITYKKRGQEKNAIKDDKIDRLLDAQLAYISGAMKHRDLRGKAYHINWIYETLTKWGFDIDDIKVYVNAYLERDQKTLDENKDITGILKQEKYQEGSNEFFSYEEKIELFRLLTKKHLTNRELDMILNVYVSPMWYYEDKILKKVMKRDDYVNPMKYIKELIDTNGKIMSWQKGYTQKEIRRLMDKIAFFSCVTVDIDLNTDKKKTEEELIVAKKEVRMLLKHCRIKFDQIYDTRNGIHCIKWFNRFYHKSEMSICAYKSLVNLVLEEVSYAVGDKYKDCVDQTSNSPTYVHRPPGSLHIKFDKNKNDFTEPYLCGSLIYEFNFRPKSVHSILYSLQEGFRNRGREELQNAANKLRLNLKIDKVIYSPRTGFVPTGKDSFCNDIRVYGMHRNEKSAKQELKNKFKKRFPKFVVDGKLDNSQANAAIASFELSNAFGYKLNERVYQSTMDFNLKQFSNSRMPVFKREKDKYGNYHEVLCLGDSSVLDLCGIISIILEISYKEARNLVLYMMGIEVISEKHKDVTAYSINCLDNHIKDLSKRINTLNARQRRHKNLCYVGRFNALQDRQELKKLKQECEILRLQRKFIKVKANTFTPNHKDAKNDSLVFSRNEFYKFCIENKGKIGLGKFTSRLKSVGNLGYFDMNVIAKDDLITFSSNIKYKHDCGRISIIKFNEKAEAKTNDSLHSLNIKDCLVLSEFTEKQRNDMNKIRDELVPKYWKDVSDKIIFDISESSRELNLNKDYLDLHVSNLPVAMVMKKIKDDLEENSSIRKLNYTMFKTAIQNGMSKILEKDETVRNICRQNKLNDVKIRYFIDKSGMKKNKRVFATYYWGSKKRFLSPWTFAYTDSAYYDEAA